MTRVLAQAAAPADTSGGDAAYAVLAQSYYALNFKLDPIDATQVGVHDYDDQIGDFSATSVASQIATDREHLAKLDAIDPSTLSPSIALDTLLRNSLLDDPLLNDTLARWRHNADDYTQSASAAAAKRMQFAIARERPIPPMLQVAAVAAAPAIHPRIR